MSKAILEFTLPEDQEAHLDALHGSEWKYVIREFDEWLRREAKYGGKTKLDITTIRSKLHELISERGLEL